MRVDGSISDQCPGRYSQLRIQLEMHIFISGRKLLSGSHCVLAETRNPLSGFQKSLAFV